MPVRETVIEGYLKDRVLDIKGRPIKLTSSNNRGVPDELCFFEKGTLVLVEVKRPGQKPRKLQREWIDWFRSMGYYATYVDTKQKVDALINWVVKKVSTEPKTCNVSNCPFRRNDE